MTERLHIYRAPSQPAHRYRVDLSPQRGMWIRRSKLSMMRAECCGKRRRAGNLTVQVYYDCVQFFCRKGKGCKR